MTVTCHDYGSLAVIEIALARLDSSNAPGAREEMRAIVTPERSVYLIDLHKVNFVDSSGVGALVGFVKFVGRERRVELCGLTPMVRKVFRLTNLLSIFTVHPDTDQGLADHGIAARVANG